MSEPSTKPYLVRAIYEWCVDAGYTPYLAVRVTAATRVPSGYVKNGEIVLNISHSATRKLTISNELIQFSARFGGVSHEISVPMDAVLGVFSRETGRGTFFEPETVSALAAPGAPATVEGEVDPEKPGPPRRPSLKVVK